MVAFPDLISGVTPINPLAQGIEFRTLLSEYDSGQVVTKQKRLFPRRSFPLQYQYLSLVEARTLWQFYLSRRGRHLPFNLFLAYADTYTGEYVGTGNGTGKIFNLPSKSATSRTIYVSGVATGHTFAAGGGEDGADKVTFSTAPGAGQYITCDFTGRLKVRCKFAEDQMTFETFFNRLVTTGLKLQGLLNA